MPRSRLAIALAACAFALPALTDGQTTVSIQLTPAGDFKPSDGRELAPRRWHNDQAVAKQVMHRFSQVANPRVLDYEHQTLHKEANGQPAPAAGWITGLEWREGSGLWGTVELTARGRDSIASGDYRYVSPVFSYDRHTGNVLDIQMAAITNTPAIDGMEPLALRAAATFGIPTDEETPMNKLLAAVVAALALGQDTTEDQAVAALNTHFKDDPLAKVRQALGVKDDQDEAAVVAACTSLKTKADAAGADPDPAKFVPVAVVDQVKADLAALTAKVQGDEVDTLVKAGLADGRLHKGQEEWARDLGMKDIAALTKYLETAQPIAALTSTQTRGRRPVMPEDGSDPVAVANRAVKYQQQQAAAGVSVSTAEAVDYVTRNPNA
jgi:phage I-like protein